MFEREQLAAVAEELKTIDERADEVLLKLALMVEGSQSLISALMDARDRLELLHAQIVRTARE